MRGRDDNGTKIQRNKGEIRSENKDKHLNVNEKNRGHKAFWLEILLAFSGTIYFGGNIVYSALPYHGALSWKIDAWRRQKEVTLKHNNFFTDGAEGILKDLDKALGLPDELYLSNRWEMTFEEDGNILTLYTFLYGKDEQGKKNTYLVDYDSKKDEKMTVWINGESNGNYNEEMKLKPMLEILNKTDYEEKVKQWSQNYKNEVYGILYYGKRSFQTAEGLQYVPGETEGEVGPEGSGNFYMLRAGGEISGYEVSLYMPGVESVTPVRYISDVTYTSQGEIEWAKGQEHMTEAKQEEKWTVDETDGSMYFFLNQTKGWRFVVADAAAGSRFYVLEKTSDGGNTWERINEDPFQSEIGVTEGLFFVDEKWGFAGLTGASGSYSSIYMTEDSGITFEKIAFPMNTVNELPELAAECNFTIKDYDYFTMPEFGENEEDKNSLFIKALTQEGETEGILFQSQDGGKSWQYDTISDAR